EQIGGVDVLGWARLGEGIGGGGKHPGGPFCAVDVRPFWQEGSSPRGGAPAGAHSRWGGRPGGGGWGPAWGEGGTRPHPKTGRTPRCSSSTCSKALSTEITSATRSWRTSAAW